MRNEYKIDWPLLKKWTKESHYSGKRLAFFIVWCILLVGSLAMTALSFTVSLYEYAVFFVFVALFCLYRAFFWNTAIAKRQYKVLAQTYGKDSWLRTICFEENEIIMKEEKSEFRYQYTDVVGIVEKGEKIYLQLRAKMVIRLYRSKFVDGSWEDCKKRILLNNPNVK